MQYEERDDDRGDDDDDDDGNELSLTAPAICFFRNAAIELMIMVTLP